MSNKFSFLFTLAVLFSLSAVAQNSCGTLTEWNSPEVVLKSTPSELLAVKQAYFKELKEFKEKANLNLRKRTEHLIIPIVVHVIHNNGPENVSDEAIHQLLNNLSDDFNGRYPNVSEVYEEFYEILGDTKVEFRLVKYGPTGKCVSGINRIVVDDPYFSNFSDGQDRIEALKRQHSWDVNKYMNFYVVGSIRGNGSDAVLGYTFFPRSTLPTTDGIVTTFDQLDGHAGIPTHEIGHYLGLPHTFSIGIAPCADTIGDGVDDTPATIGYPSACPSKTNSYSCGTLDNVHNIMDVSTCRVNFTEGQSAVMRGVLGKQRKTLVSAQNLIDVGADYDLEDSPQFLCTADFGKSTDMLFCPGSEIEFEERTVHDATTFTWNFEGGIPSTSNERNPTILYNNPGRYEVSLTVSDGDTSITVTKDGYIVIENENFLGNSYGEGFETIDLSSTENIFIANEDGDKTFEISREAGFQSLSSIYLRNSAVISDRTDDIVTNTLDISQVENPIISFDFAFAKRNSFSDDNLEVLVSSDCGAKWQRRKLLRADASLGSSSSLVTASDQNSGEFVPNNEQWKNYTVDVNSFKSEGFKVKLTWTSGSGNNIYIDNLFIGSAAAVGVGENARENMVKLFPNPNNGDLNIVSEAGTILNVEVMNVYGAVVYSETFNAVKVNVNLGDAKPGVYFARVRNANGNTINMKFIVE